MKLGIIQPYFFPYLGYFSIIKHVDKFILFDTVQYIRHGWIDRNRILKPDNGWQYINVPLIKPNGRETLIKDLIVNNEVSWERKILSQLDHYKKKGPYYNCVMKLLYEIFSVKYDNIVSLNKNVIEKICSYIGFDKTLPVFSKMNLEIKEANTPDEWALNICKKIDGVTDYYNAPGGASFFDRTKYKAANINLYFHNIELNKYDQKREDFEVGLSIIDVMMFKSPEEISAMLNKYTLS